MSGNCNSLEQLIPAWRVVASGHEIVRKGLRWEGGDGATIRLLEDPWVSNWSLFLVSNAVQHAPDIADLTVQSFITAERRWDQHKQNEVFNLDVVRLIAIISIARSPMLDRLRFLGDDLSSYSMSKA